MKNLPAIKQLILGDFRERTRSYSFLLTLLGTLFFGYLVITDQYSVRFGTYRGEFNGAWEGNIMAVSCSIMLTIFGFYLVKNSIRRDRVTNVGQVLAAGSMKKLTYLVAKALSNCLVLLTMVGILAGAALVMVLLLKARIDLNPWYLLSPFIFVAIPAMTLVAALAVLFESVRWLRGSFGNVAYFFVAEGLLLSGMLKPGLIDIAGAGLFTDGIRKAIEAAYPGAKYPMIMGFVRFDPAIRELPFRTFPYTGIDWTSEFFLLRLSLIVAACLAVALAVPFFDRFDPATQRVRSPRLTKKRKRQPEVAPPAVPGTSVTLAGLPSPAPRFRLTNMIVAELKLMTKGYHWFWYVIALGLVVAQSAAPYDLARMYLAPVSVVWYLTVFSGMGSRERRFNTRELLFSSPRPLRHQYLSTWAAGVMMALVAMSGMIVRGLIGGDPAYVGALLAGAVFVPSMALLLGTLSNSKKLFEVVFLLVWYIGTIEHMTPLDFLGTTPETIAVGMPVVFALLGAGLVLAAFYARRRQLVL